MQQISELPVAVIGPAPARQDACCVADAVAKDEGKSGCGCGSKVVSEKVIESV